MGVWKTVGPDNLYEGLFYYDQLNLSEFNGLPVVGVWAVTSA